MGAVDHLGKQFWKANPNQMALPGMEEHSHAGAKALSQGYHFETEHDDDETTVRALHHADDDMDENHGVAPGELSWDNKNGEIHWAGSRSDFRGAGLPTALYGMGRQMGRVKPRHSTVRTTSGDAWAHSVTDKYGGRVPKTNNIGRGY